MTLALLPDHTDEAALSIRQGSTRIVQITLGARVRLSITTGTETLEVDGRHPPAEQIHGVLAVHRDDVEIAPDESDLDFDFDETILTLGEEQPRSPHETSVPALEPDFDATILTPRVDDAGQTADGGRSAGAAPSDPVFFFIDLADRNGRVLHRVDGTTWSGAPRATATTPGQPCWPCGA
ncbi:hypothetical protein [Frondihabitans sp. VKM Ac-2883]|uniref:hypothetical protein n=1 Tax=Frondihabitans sp. VKM Ac-2883 TaxID=2783823 RepID=UPI00188A40BF|nr:hypothetical protein [Frondihabitans sp. VKM Ac-2883]MBF4576405.1 hypothetical protein [Frondihabitans sp. VKM Ac-2883]